MTGGGSDLGPMLARWLPAQRWFAGSGATIRDITITSDVLLQPGDPELRHLVADVLAGQDKVSYQLLVAFRGEFPGRYASSAIGTMPDGRLAYDAADDPELTRVLLDGIAAGRAAGRLRFAAEPGAVIDRTALGRAMPPLHSNTAVVFGDRAILKLLRRPFEGHHPDLEIPAALARGGSKLVAAPLGWIEMAGEEATPGNESAAPTLLAILSEFFTGATDGWSMPTYDLLAGRPDFSREARQLGEAAAQMHAELAAAFGSAELRPAEVAEMADAMKAELARAVGVVPELADYEAGVRACYDDLRAAGPTVTVQRIHGDYHLAQVLRTDGGWVVLDFEGEPSVPLARRRAFAPAMRDVAGMLRSFDYAARHQALARPGDHRFGAAALDWAGRCREAFCAGYASASGANPLDAGPLLRALTFSKAVYEAVYEANHRPGWLPIPLAALAEARS